LGAFTIVSTATCFQHFPAFGIELFQKPQGFYYSNRLVSPPIKTFSLSFPLFSLGKTCSRRPFLRRDVNRLPPGVSLPPPRVLLLTGTLTFPPQPPLAWLFITFLSPSSCQSLRHQWCQLTFSSPRKVPNRLLDALEHFITISDQVVFPSARSVSVLQGVNTQTATLVLSLPPFYPVF